MKFNKIKGYERYSISDTGKVINNITGDIISQRVSNNGYYRFNVRLGEMKELKRVQNKAAGITKDIKQYSKNGNLIKKYDNAHEAARNLFPDSYKYKDRLISRCARGQTKTAYGYKWEYV